LYSRWRQRGPARFRWPRKRLDETWAIGGIPQRFPQLVDRRIQAVVEINEGIGRPVLIAKFFACDHFARPLQQDRKDVEGLFLELDPRALLAQLPRAQVYLKHSKAQDCGRLLLQGH